jgi:hypothetical protein
LFYKSIRLSILANEVAMIGFIHHGHAAARPGRLAPSAETLREWPRARALAQRYWERVAGETLLAEAFRVLAGRHAASLRGSQPTHR